MAAICGLFGRPAADAAAPEDLRRMVNALKVRAAGEASLFAPAGTVRFAVRNGAGGKARMSVTPDGRYSAVADGQVFNRADLVKRASIARAGIDAEDSTALLLNIFASEGTDGLRSVDGQFAIAIWDRAENKLFLIRDFLGVIPIYYCKLPQGAAFSSEIKGLLQHPGVGRSYDLAAVSNYLTFLTVPGPATLFANINKLQPGSVAGFDAAGHATLDTYWDLLQEPIPERDESAFYIDKIRELHAQSIRRRVADGPVGALLSGGNDSSANVALIARFAEPPPTFTVGLEDVEGDPAYTDLEYARKVSKLVGTEHHELLLTTDQFLETIPVVAGLLDDLVSEPSSIFLYKALQLARGAGVNTLITGEANDELCCGHGEMISIRNGYYRRWAPFMRWPRAIRQVMAAAAPVMFPQRSDILRRAARGEEYFWSFEIGWPGSAKGDILSRAALDQLGSASSADVVGRCKERFGRSGHASRDYLNYIVYAMMQDFYFGNLMLGKLDLLARGVGLNALCPYTEPNYAHFAYNIPAKFKMQDGTVKWFFKKAIEGLLPDPIIYRPKQGFRTPVVELFRGRLGKWAEPYLLEGGFTKAGVTDRRHVARLLSEHRSGATDHSNKLWTLMALNLWHERWLGASRDVADD